MKKTAFITGATSGIGEACARKFAEGGYRLVITGRNAAKLETLKTTLEAEGTEVRTLVFDVRDAAAAKAARSPYNGGDTAQKICTALKNALQSGLLRTVKSFYDGEVPSFTL